MKRKITMRHLIEESGLSDNQILNWLKGNHIGVRGYGPEARIFGSIWTIGSRVPDKEWLNDIHKYWKFVSTPYFGFCWVDNKLTQERNFWTKAMCGLFVEIAKGRGL